jgi:hypothetical protein
MGCHGESIDDHHDHGITTGVWKVINKIHGQFRPDAIGHGKWQLQPGGGQGLVFVSLTYFALCNVGAEIWWHMGPRKEFVNSLHHF